VALHHSIHGARIPREEEGAPVLTCESTSRKVSEGQGCGITEREEGAWGNASRDGSQKRSMFISALALEKLCSRTLTPTASHLTSFEPLLLLLPPSLVFGGGGVHDRRSVRGSALRDSRQLRSDKRRTCMHLRHLQLLQPLKGFGSGGTFCVYMYD